MATVSELMAQGVCRMRLPFWNEHAYVEPREVGPWADLHDVGSQLPVLISECDQDNRWEAQNQDTKGEA